MHLISMLDIEDQFHELLDLSAKIKKNRGKYARALAGKSLGMIFEKPSLRTRVSFEVGMTQLGGHALYISPNEIQLGKRESVHDVAKVLSRLVDGIMYRAFDYRIMKELAKHADIPVINGLDDREHPCQIMADILTMKEYVRDLEGKKVTYVGDGNNVCNSLLLGAAMAGMDMSVASPKGYEPDDDIIEATNRIAKKTGSKVEVVQDPLKACEGTDFIYTDIWVSMGDEAESAVREKIFAPYQVNSRLMDVSKKALFLHCLPAHRGLEVTADVIDSDRSIVFPEAENRLHAQKGIMVYLMGDKE
jgi:ornithine carbamoyltransferase